MGLWDNVKAAVDPESAIRDAVFGSPDITDMVRKEMYAAGAHTPVPLPYSTHRPLVAAGQRIRLKNADDIMGLRNRVYTEWQNDAWAYYDAIGEIKYGFGLVGSVMSRLRIYPSVVADENSVPLAISEYTQLLAGMAPDASEGSPNLPLLSPAITSEVLAAMDQLVRNLRSGAGGISGVMRMFAINMGVAGECYLVRVAGKWFIKSTSELIVNQGGTIILRSQRAGSSTTTAGTIYGDVILPSSTPIFRLWREHPRYSHEPESSMLGLREICDEIITLQRMIRTTARSRTNAGILYLPDGLTVAGSQVADSVATEEEALDTLTAAVYDTLTAPLVDESNAATVVPLMVTGPSDEAKNITYIEVSRKIDQFLVERLDKALERLLAGLDMPKDAFTGQNGRGSMRQSNARYAQMIQRQMYTEHIEPLALMFVDAISTSYIRPALKRQFPQLSTQDLDRLGVWYDPSELLIQPDDLQAADQGLNSFALSAAAWRRVSGYSEADAPSEYELLMRYFLTKVVAQPDQAEVIMQALFPALMNTARAENIRNGPIPFPASAGDLLYGDVAGGAQSKGASTDGVDGKAPTSPQTYTNANNQENRGSQVRDENLYPGPMTRAPGIGAGTYGGGY